MVLLVVDTQKGIMNTQLFAFDEVQKNIKLLISTAREQHVEVIFVRKDDGPGSGFSKGDDVFEIYEAFAPLKGEKIFDKKVNSALHSSTGLCDYLAKKSEKQIMIVGLLTDFCIDATVKSGFEHGYHMIVPEYTNSSFDNEYFGKEVAYRFYNELMWPKRYADTVTMEEAIEMLRCR